MSDCVCATEKSSTVAGWSTTGKSRMHWVHVQLRATVLCADWPPYAAGALLIWLRARAAGKKQA